MESVIVNLFGFLKILVVCGAGMIALFLILLALPNSSVKELLLRFLKPVAISATALAVGTDITLTLPGLGELGDLGLLAGVAWSWLNFLKDIRAMNASSGRISGDSHIEKR